jgi:putative hemolysin
LKNWQPGDHDACKAADNLRGQKVDHHDGANLTPVEARHRKSAPVASPEHAGAAGERPVLGRIGSLETRLARNQAEIEQAQALRHAVFHQEIQRENLGSATGAAIPVALPSTGPGACQSGLRDRSQSVADPFERVADLPPGSQHRDANPRDSDAWDSICEHLLVIDREGGAERIVGTYRFLTSRIALQNGMPFYTSQEFEIEPLMARHKGLEFMELGRSCVLPQWRNKRTMELMWHGVWAHVLEHGVDVLIGCASFPGMDAELFAEPLAFLHHFAAPRDGWQVRARSARSVTTNLMPAGAVNKKRALHALPPLIKGYLRLGARFAQEAAIDPDFGTTDVLVMLPVAAINPRYVEHYGADAGRYAV